MVVAIGNGRLLCMGNFRPRGRLAESSTLLLEAAVEGNGLGGDFLDAPSGVGAASTTSSTLDAVLSMGLLFAEEASCFAGLSNLGAVGIS